MKQRGLTTALVSLFVVASFLTGTLLPVFAADQRTGAGESGAPLGPDGAGAVPFIVEGFEQGVGDWTLQSKAGDGDGSVSLEYGSYTSGGGDGAGSGYASWGSAPNGGYGGTSDAAGGHSVRIAPGGEGGWRFASLKQIPVATGDRLELRGWIRRQGSGSTTLTATGCDAQGNAVAWKVEAPVIEGEKAWTPVVAPVVIPPGVAFVQAQLAGEGGGVTWLDDLCLVPVMAPRRNPAMPAEARLENAAIAVSVHTGDITLSVADKRTGQTWRQRPLRSDFILLDVQRGNSILLALRDRVTGQDTLATIRLVGDRPEFTVTLSGDGTMASPVSFPHPFVSAPGTQLVLPRGEGVLYPVDEPSLPAMRLPAYSGEGLTMPFWGITDGDRGLMTLLETPDDSAAQIERIDGMLAVSPQWDPQKGRLGYSRRLRYVLFDKGGFVAMAKRYRDQVREAGRWVSLEEKIRLNPMAGKLIGAASVWYTGKGDRDVARDMKDARMDKVLWNHDDSGGQVPLKPETVEDIQALGYLAGRYDVFHRAIDPEQASLLEGGLDPRWPQSAWPDGLVTGADGNWVRGWKAKGQGGGWIDGAIVNDEEALTIARWRIPSAVEKAAYGAWLIDGATSLPWQEDYSPRHPMTRSQSRQQRINLLKVAADECKRVTGSVSAHDAAAPVVHYFEGAMSVAKDSVDEQRRIPLWELVYHDSVLSYWHREEGNNSRPDQWLKRDRLNILYGTPPLYTLSREAWETGKKNIVESDQQVSAVAAKVGTAEMTDFRYLTPDRSVQQSVFANGVTVTVNFGSSPYQIDRWTELPPMGYRVVETQEAGQ
ncbi:hypothetical protein GTO89_15915 [Heliobacterium gestii]|uniref:Uncharacterized protein n=1 Tax=Heliomicrobium gestii TaxID=2699 RepID=A0A845LEB7_HELGE|nr:glycoside hydrolase [Heliomicrobium gestii]MBM7868327.1 hypothetical protein [Heliomicrobium gestii]MZP44518.1 hypothetical protein [Heliomicrobium gestii]